MRGSCQPSRAGGWRPSTSNWRSGSPISRSAPVSRPARSAPLIAAFTTGYSADGLVEVSRFDGELDAAHHHAWYARRTHDVHDIWHVLTGYQADEVLGEAALIGFSHAQVGGPGWAFIGGVAALKSVRVTRGTLFAQVIGLAGAPPGSSARSTTLMHEPLAAARARLNVREPVAYRRAPRVRGSAMAAYPGMQRAGAPAHA